MRYRLLFLPLFVAIAACGGGDDGAATMPTNPDLGRTWLIHTTLPNSACTSATQMEEPLFIDITPNTIVFEAVESWPTLARVVNDVTSQSYEGGGVQLIFSPAANTLVGSRIFDTPCVYTASISAQQTDGSVADLQGLWTGTLTISENDCVFPGYKPGDVRDYSWEFAQNHNRISILPGPNAHPLFTSYGIAVDDVFQIVARWGTLSGGQTQQTMLGRYDPASGHLTGEMVLNLFYFGCTYAGSFNLMRAP